MTTVVMNDINKIQTNYFHIVENINIEQPYVDVCYLLLTNIRLSQKNKLYVIIQNNTKRINEHKLIKMILI